MDQQRLSLFALFNVAGVGDRLLKQLINYCGTAEQVFNTPKGKLLKIPGVGEVTATAILSKKSYSYAEQEITKATQSDTQILFYTDPSYPNRLKQQVDAPVVIYYQGKADLNAEKIVGIVGTRRATSYGKEMVTQIVSELIPHQPIIVSGLAYGIDICAHREALKNKMQTIGIMGSGIDIIYPSAHRETAKKMIEHGGLMTEHKFGTTPDAFNFPARNRIIAGLCDAIIVVEAAEKGGALITAEIANSYNKDVFAVPGNIGNQFSEGCNKLIKTNKANLYSSIKDLEYLMNWGDTDTPLRKNQSTHLDLTLFEPNEQIIIQLLHVKSTPMMIDELSIKSTLSPSVLASLLLQLELKNIVKSFPGKMFGLVK